MVRPIVHICSALNSPVISGRESSVLPSGEGEKEVMRVERDRKKGKGRE